jgi:SAM-dependent methyltransferase
MPDIERREHWDSVYETKAETGVSWFEESPALSLELIASAGAKPDSAIIDIGGGLSRLVDALLDQAYGDLSVLDISEVALAKGRARLGDRAGQVRWITADVTLWRPERTYDIWHDRAVFHFLTEPADQAAYMERMDAALRPGGHVIIGTFALDGPERCSGLPVMRHDEKSLARALPPGFEPKDARRYEHRTPGGSVQRFQFSTFRKD